MHLKEYTQCQSRAEQKKKPAKIEPPSNVKLFLQIPYIEDSLLQNTTTLKNPLSRMKSRAPIDENPIHKPRESK